MLSRLTFRNGRVTRLGEPPLGIRLLLWATGIAIVGLLLLFAVWVALVIVLAWVAFKLMRIGGRAGQFTWEPTDPDDRRRHLFYDPLTHNHDPDPRFEDN